MTMISEKNIKKMIVAKVEQGLNKLPKHLKEWSAEHLIKPRKIIFYSHLDIGEKDSAWLVTDHIGRRDSSYRVIYNKELDMFGLVVDLIGGTVHCLGYSGDFDKAIEGM